MKILSHNQGAERKARRIETQRVLSDICLKLAQFSPNSVLNVRCPWKGDRAVLRAWCPLHNGRWVRLIVRAADDGHLTFECEAGCTQQEVENAINAIAGDRIAVIADGGRISPAPPCPDAA